MKTSRASWREDIQVVHVKAVFKDLHLRVIVTPKEIIVIDGLDALIFSGNGFRGHVDFNQIRDLEAIDDSGVRTGSHPRAAIQPGRAVKGVFADAGDASVQVVVRAVLAELPFEAVAAVALRVFVVGVEDKGLSSGHPYIEGVADGDERGGGPGVRRDGRLDDAVRRQIQAEKEEGRQRRLRENAREAWMQSFRHVVSFGGFSRQSFHVLANRRRPAVNCNPFPINMRNYA